MNQALYAHMNNKRKKKKKRCLLFISFSLLPSHKEVSSSLHKAVPTMMFFLITGSKATGPGNHGLKPLKQTFPIFKLIISGILLQQEKVD
jgi:hypothetical protein